MYDIASTLESYTIPEYDIATEGIAIQGVMSKVFSVMAGKIGGVVKLIGAFIVSIVGAKAVGAAKRKTNEEGKNSNRYKTQYNKVVINSYCKKLIATGNGACSEIRNYTSKLSSFLQTTEKADANAQQKYGEWVGWNPPTKSIKSLEETIEDYEQEIKAKDGLYETEVEIDNNDISNLKRERDMLKSIHGMVVDMSKKFLNKNNRDGRNWANVQAYDNLNTQISSWGKLSGNVIKYVTKAIHILMHHSSKSTFTE